MTVARVAPNQTKLLPGELLKLDPLMVTELPVYPFSGLTVEMAGAGITVTMLVLLDRTPLVLQVPAPTHVNTQK